MAQVSKAVLKTYFEDGKEPDENKYIDLIDSLMLEGGVDHGTLTGLADDDHPQYLLADGSRNLTGDLTVTDDLQVNDDVNVRGGLYTGISSAPFTIPDGTIFVNDDGVNAYGFMSAQGPFFMSANTYYDGTNWRNIASGPSATFYVANNAMVYRTDVTSRSPGDVGTHAGMMQVTSTGSMTLEGGLVIGNYAGAIDNDNVTFYQGTTRVGEVGSDNTAWLKINHVTNLPVYCPRHMRVDGGVSATSSISDPGDGNFAAQKFNLYDGGTHMGGITANETTWFRINQDAAKNIYTPRFLAAAVGLQAGGSTNPGTGYVGYTVGLRPNKNSTQYTAWGYRPLTTPLTSTSWDGDSKGNTGGTKIDLSASFGVPAGIKAIHLRIIGKANNAGPNDTAYFFVGPSATYDAYVGVYLWGNVYMSETGVAACDANGDIYYTLSSGATAYCIIRILGYFI